MAHASEGEHDHSKPMLSGPDERFDLLAKVGDGSFGTVYKGQVETFRDFS